MCFLFFVVTVVFFCAKSHKLKAMLSHPHIWRAAQILARVDKLETTKTKDTKQTGRRDEEKQTFRR